MTGQEIQNQLVHLGALWQAAEAQAEVYICMQPLAAQEALETVLAQLGREMAELGEQLVSSPTEDTAETAFQRMRQIITQVQDLSDI